MLTLICPAYNEADYIESVLRFFVKSSPLEKQLFIIDGGSTDDTKIIVNEWAKKYNNIFLLNNPNKYVPFALNIGIKNSTGDPIIRLDAHTEYANDYLQKIIETFEKTGADIVGGSMNAVGNSGFQKAVAYATSTQFGVGDSKIHQESYEGESDHVYLGAWKRKLFDEIGYFDERLKRNQDDEFHYRARSLGKRIYLNPEIKSYYYPRNSLSKLVKQYFQYGFFKPIVLRKIKSEIKFRHLIPSLFCIYILSFPLAFLSRFYFVPLFVYMLTDIYFSIRAKSNIKIVINSLFIYPALHLSYGFGFLSGLFKVGARN